MKNMFVEEIVKSVCGGGRTSKKYRIRGTLILRQEKGTFCHDKIDSNLTKYTLQNFAIFQVRRGFYIEAPVMEEIVMLERKRQDSKDLGQGPNDQIPA